MIGGCQRGTRLDVDEALDWYRPRVQGVVERDEPLGELGFQLASGGTDGRCLVARRALRGQRAAEQSRRAEPQRAQHSHFIDIVGGRGLAGPGTPPGREFAAGLELGNRRGLERSS